MEFSLGAVNCALFARTPEARVPRWNVTPCSLLAACEAAAVQPWAPFWGGPMAPAPGLPEGPKQRMRSPPQLPEPFQQAFSLPFEYVAQPLLLKCVLLLYVQNALSLIFHSA